MIRQTRGLPPGPGGCPAAFASRTFGDARSTDESHPARPPRASPSQLTLLHDDRGFFAEGFRADRMMALGLPAHFAQDNHSRSAPGVLRGLHYQRDPWQGKLVGVVRGRIWDVVVDVRPDSATFGRSYGVELSDMNGRLLWIPAGFAHGF